MSVRLSSTQHVVLGTIGVVAAAGWIFALYLNQEMGILNRDLERLTSAKEALEQVRSEFNHLAVGQLTAGAGESAPLDGNVGNELST